MSSLRDTMDDLIDAATRRYFTLQATLRRFRCKRQRYATLRTLRCL